MARSCDICGKGSQMINNRPHSLHITKKKQQVNLQWAKDKNGKRIKVCMSCLKKLHRK